MVVQVRDFKHKIHYSLDIEARKQWTHAGGYCGENSIQTIALRFGMYTSQELIRKFADNRELLVGPPGVVGQGAQDEGPYAGHMPCDVMGLDYDLFDTLGTQAPQQKAYYDWCKDHVKTGNYPIICYTIPNRDCSVSLPVEKDEEEEVASAGEVETAPTTKVVTACVGSEEHMYSHIVNLSDIHEFHGQDWRNSYWMIHEHLDDEPLPFVMKNMDGVRREPHPMIGMKFPYFKDECYGMSITGKTKRLEGEVPVALTLKRPDADRLYYKEAPYDTPDTILVKVVASGLNCDSTYRIEKGQEPKLDVDSTVLLDSGEEATVEKFDNDTKQWLLKKKDGTTVRKFGMELLQWETVNSFTATDSTFTWKDPQVIASNGAVAYRCIEEQ